MWDFIFVGTIILAAAAYLGFRFKAVWRIGQNNDACGGCDGVCDSEPQGSGGFSV